MNGKSGLERLFLYAARCNFRDFNDLFSELEVSLALADLWEAYLMRAQIKLYAADGTIGVDLDSVDQFSGPPRFPSLSNIWLSDAPNRFIVFSKAPGQLHGFLQVLPRVRRQLSRWYGRPGEIAVRQMQGEILYFLGKIREALDLAEEQHQAEPRNSTDSILTQALRFRCYLALHRPGKAEECMLDMIKLSQAHPECQASYQAVRGWANLTTNWNGDTPRFYNDPSGKRMPVLDDRLENIRRGNACATPLEKPFVGYAERGYEQAYAVRQYYMDLFHAMYWFQVGDHQQTELYFLRLCQIAGASGVYMPFVECGEQITPLLRHVQAGQWSCSRQWLDMVITRAGEYEQGLKAYQDSDT